MAIADNIRLYDKDSSIRSLNTARHRNGVIISPVLCLVSVVCSRISRFARHGVDNPGAASLGVQLSLFLFRELGIRYELFHNEPSFLILL